jgi:hypothetical protein
MNIQLKCQLAYSKRNFVLKSLGYRNYYVYLQSDLWDKIRTRVFIRDKNICFGCGEKATQVHHANYNKEVLKGKTIKGLYSVCSSCHTKIEYVNNAKVDPHTATTLLKEIRRSSLGNHHENSKVCGGKIVRKVKKIPGNKLTSREIGGKLKVLDRDVMRKLSSGKVCGSEHGKNCLCSMYRMFKN